MSTGFFQRNKSIAIGINDREQLGPVKLVCAQFPIFVAIKFAESLVDARERLISFFLGGQIGNGEQKGADSNTEDDSGSSRNSLTNSVSGDA